jgi:hemoglobin/transferrin/lactoferrin receptor protein
MIQPPIRLVPLSLLGGLLMTAGTLAAQTATAPAGTLETTTLVSTRTARSALESPGSIVSIDLTKDDSELTKDVGDLVSQTPSVDVPFDHRGMDTLIPYLNGGYQSFNVRGVDGNRVLLEIDGIRQVPEYSEYLGGGSGGTTRAMFDPKVFESVDILKGSASALYGSDALGGVISMKTLSLVDYLEVSERPWYLATSFGYYDVNESFNQVTKAGVRAGNLYATVVNSYREGSEYQNDHGAAPYPEDSQSNHLLASVAFIPSKIHRLSLVVENFTSENTTDMTGIAYEMTLGGRPYTIDYSTLATSGADLERTRVSLKYENKPVNAGLWDEFSAHLYYQSSESEIDTTTVGTVGYAVDSLYPGYQPSVRNRKDVMDFNHEVVGLNLLARKRLETGAFTHTTIVGADLSTEDAKNTFLRYDTATSGTVTTTNKIAMDPSTLNRADLFVQDEIDWKNWLFVGGVRYSHYEIKPDNDPAYLAANPSISASENYTNDTLTPSVSAVYKLTKESALWARYAMGIKNPTSENYTGAFSHSGGSDPFIILANPDLDPEKSDAVEIGYRQHTALYQFEVSAHQTYYRDFIDSSVLIEDNVAPEADVYSHANIGRVEIWGADASFKLELKALSPSLDGFSLRLASAWLDGQNESDDLPLATVPPFETVTTLAYRHADKWGASLTGTYRAKKSHAEAIAAQGYFIPDHSFVTDAYAWYKLTPKITLRAGVNNLTDEKYWIWSNSSRGGHSGTVTERNVQPGVNFYTSVDIVF